MEEKSSYDIQVAVQSKNEHDTQVLARLGKKSVLKVDTTSCTEEVIIDDYGDSVVSVSYPCWASLAQYWSHGKEA